VHNSVRMMQHADAARGAADLLPAGWSTPGIRT